MPSRSSARSSLSLPDEAVVTRELFIELRGRLPQPTFSKALGYTSNVATSWENGRRTPEVTALLRAALVAGIDLRPRLREFFRDGPPELARCRLGSPKTSQLLVEHLVAGHTKQELAAKIGVNRSTIARWCNGQTDPKVPEFLRLVAVCTQRLLDFVCVFCSPARLDSTRTAHRALVAQRRVAYDTPFSHAVLRALELDGYRSARSHSSAWLGKQLGLTDVEVEAQLTALQAADQVRFEAGRWVPAELLTVDTREDPERDRALKIHWAETALQRMKNRTFAGDGLFSYNLFAISDEQYEEIRQLHLEYYHRVRAIVDAARSADRVVVVNLQLVPLRPS
jgi:transcriptional regulator with XRE-family HTH domain